MAQRRGDRQPYLAHAGAGGDDSTDEDGGGFGGYRGRDVEMASVRTVHDGSLLEALPPGARALLGGLKRQIRAVTASPWLGKLIMAVTLVGLLMWLLVIAYRLPVAGNMMSRSHAAEQVLPGYHWVVTALQSKPFTSLTLVSSTQQMLEFHGSLSNKLTVRFIVRPAAEVNRSLSEVAVFHVARALGMQKHVPACAMRSIAMSELAALAGMSSSRLPAGFAASSDGQVSGMVSLLLRNELGVAPVTRLPPVWLELWRNGGMLSRKASDDEAKWLRALSSMAVLDMVSSYPDRCNQGGLYLLVNSSDTSSLWSAEAPVVFLKNGAAFQQLNAVDSVVGLEAHMKAIAEATVNGHGCGGADQQAGRLCVFSEQTVTRVYGAAGGTAFVEGVVANMRPESIDIQTVQYVQDRQAIMSAAVGAVYQLMRTCIAVYGKERVVI